MFPNDLQVILISPKAIQKTKNRLSNYYCPDGRLVRSILHVVPHFRQSYEPFILCVKYITEPRKMSMPVELSIGFIFLNRFLKVLVRKMSVGM
jgi:hypothetical protein